MTQPDSTQVTDTYAPQLDVDLSRMQRSETGLHTETIVEGDGDAVQAGDSVQVHYTGWFPDGRTFDSSRAPNRGPYGVRVGAGGVIAGWDEGLQGMRVGERRRLVVPPALGYGSQGYPGAIPPNATLVFEIELVEIVR